jgi:putative protein-disulfide isomerase
MDKNDNPVLWYFADPMCSWCWGFSPVISEIKKKYAERIKIALVMGGLQIGEDQVLSESSREEVLHHWHQVKGLSGQTFSFDNAMPEGFIYNTEPACRAVITVGMIDAIKNFQYFTAIQEAFYTKNLDVTQFDCLQKIAVDCGIDAKEFKQRFNSEELLENTIKHFKHARKAGVTGFPSLILILNNELNVVTRGYQDYASVSAELDKLLPA